MNLLVFSDVHGDLAACRSIVDRSGAVDVVVGAGDFARQHRLLGETIDALRSIRTLIREIISVLQNFWKCTATRSR